MQIRRLLGVSESKANLHGHRGNGMQTLTILDSTVKSPVDICPASSPTPTKTEVVFFSGASSVIFFSPGRENGRVFGTPSFRLAFTQSALLHLRNRFETLQGCLQDAQNPSKIPPRCRQRDAKTPQITSSMQTLFRLRCLIAHSFLCLPSNKPAR